MRSTSRDSTAALYSTTALRTAGQAVAVEQIHPGAAGQRIPPGPLEQRQQRGLVEMAERVAFIRVDGQLDGREGGGHEAANVCQKTTRCTFHVPRSMRMASAFAP